MLVRMKKNIENIIIHCSATPNGRAHTADDIRHWHTDPKPKGRGWKHAGYHFVIRVNGLIESLVAINDDAFLEPWEIANGAHGHNQNSIHICLIGSDAFSRNQWSSLYHLLISLRQQCPGATAHGHREFNPHKDCPGFEVGHWLTEPERVEMAHRWGVS